MSIPDELLQLQLISVAPHRSAHRTAWSCTGDCPLDFQSYHDANSFPGHEWFRVVELHSINFFVYEHYFGLFVRFLEFLKLLKLLFGVASFLVRNNVFHRDCARYVLCIMLDILHDDHSMLWHRQCNHCHSELLDGHVVE